MLFSISLRSKHWPYCYCLSDYPNFSVRPLNMDIHLQSFTISHFPSLMIAMAKPAYLAIAEFSPHKPVIIFVPSRKQCGSTASDILTYCLADDQEDRFLHLD